MTTRIEVADGADDAARLDLHEQAFGYRPPRGTFRWKYRENPHGAAIELVVREGARVVAAFALVPRRIAIGNEVVLAHQAADAMTHGAAQRRGWFTRLLEEGHALAREQGSAFAFAFSGRRSRTPFARTGYAEIGSYAVVERRLWGPGPIGRRSAWSIGRVEDVVANGVGPIRDGDWLRWRLRGIEPRLHHILQGGEDAWAAVERHDALAVLACHAPPPRRARELRPVLRALRATGVRRVRRTAFREAPDDGAWRGVGLGFRASRALPFCVRPLARGLDELLPRVRPEVMTWCDLDRDAQGLLLRMAVEGRAR